MAIMQCAQINSKQKKRKCFSSQLMRNNTQMLNPTLQSILVTKDVATCSGCGRKNILEIFNKVNLEFLPNIFPDRFCVYYAFTDIRIRSKIRFEIVHLSSKEKVYEEFFTLKAKNPLEIVDGTLSITNFPLAGDGIYSLIFWENQQVLGSSKLTILSEDRDNIKK